MTKDIAELIAGLSKALNELQGAPEEDLRTLLEALYAVDPRLSAYIDEVAEHVRAPSPGSVATIGQKLEQVAYLAFSGLNGYPDVQAFRSASSQHDLLVRGDGNAAKALCTLIRVSDVHRGILVECKAEKQKVGDPEFRRLCALLSEHFQQTVAMGVFMTLKGATGFPPSGAGTEVRKIGDSRLTQIIYYARTRKPIVVLDWKDIQTLTKPGSLPLLLKQRIEDIENLGATARPAHLSCEPTLLPSHLLELR